MNADRSLLGTWISLSLDSGSAAAGAECVWHVVDDTTCVYEMRTGSGLMISWFQCWPCEGGILRFPLGKITRQMFKGAAEFVPIAWDESGLTMNGFRFERVEELPVPERNDVYPGLRPGEDGSAVGHSFVSEILDHLPEPPMAGAD